MVSSISPAHFPWFSTGSTLNPITLQLRLAKSGAKPAMEPSSVVHTGVKSLGCENRTAHPSPIHWWKWMVPWVVSAVKSGAVSLIRRDIGLYSSDRLVYPPPGRTWHSEIVRPKGARFFVILVFSPLEHRSSA